VVPGAAIVDATPEATSAYRLFGPGEDAVKPVVATIGSLYHSGQYVFVDTAVRCI